MRMIFVIPEKKNREDKTLIALRTVFKWSAKIPEKKLLIWHGSYRSFQFDSFSNQKYPQTLQRVTQFGLFCPKRNKKKNLSGTTDPSARKDLLFRKFRRLFHRRRLSTSLTGTKWQVGYYCIRLSKIGRIYLFILFFQRRGPNC